jgi:hypothetical protein
VAAAQTRRRLNAEFVRAVLASSTPRYVLARRCGIEHGQHLASLLHAGVVVASPRTVARLEVLAQLVSFEGEVLLDEVAPVVVKRDRFDVEHLPAPTPVRR